MSSLYKKTKKRLFSDNLNPSSNETRSRDHIDSRISDGETMSIDSNPSKNGDIRDFLRRSTSFSKKSKMKANKKTSSAIPSTNDDKSNITPTQSKSPNCPIHETEEMIQEPSIDELNLDAKSEPLTTKPANEVFSGVAENASPGSSIAPILSSSNIAPDVVQPYSLSESDESPSNEDIEAGLGFDIEETNELTPLLSISSSTAATPLRAYMGIPYFTHPSEIWRVFCFYLGKIVHAKLLYYLIFLLIILGAIFELLSCKINVIIEQSVELEVKDLSLLSFTDDGVNAHAVGSIYINYDKINNHFYREISKFGSLLAGSLLIQPTTMTLFVRNKNSDFQSLHVANVYLPELFVNLHNNRRTGFDFISKTQIIRENISDLLRQFDYHGSKEIQIECIGVLNAHIQGKFFRIDKNFIKIKKNIELSSEKSKNPPIHLHNLKIAMDDNQVYLYSGLQFTSGLPARLHLDAINWELQLQGCNQTYIKIGEWNTSEVYVEPNSLFEFQISGVIENFPSEFFAKCNDTALSPLNKILQDYLRKNQISIILNASKNQLHDLPSWLYYILSTNTQELVVTIPSGNITIDEYTLNSLDVEVLSKRNSMVQNLFDINLSSNISIVTDLPMSVDFRIPRFTTNFNVKNSTKDVLITGRSRKFNSLILGEVDNSLGLDFDVRDIDIQILHPAEVGQLANLYINGELDESIYLDVKLDELILELPNLKTELNSLNVTDFLLPSALLVPQRDINEIVAGINFTLSDIIFVESKPDSLEVLLDMEITNPMNVSIDLPDEHIEVELQYNSTSIGSVYFDDLYIPKQKTANATIGLRFSTIGVTDKIVFEYFLSRYISGFQDLLVGVANGSARCSSGLSTLLQQIDLQNVRIPVLDVPVASISQPKALVKKTPSPFLLSATIHILTSEVELKLYNPIQNAELVVNLYQAEAKYQDQLLGYTSRRELLLIPPGIYHSPRISIKIAEGIGMDILRKAMGDRLDVEITALFGIKLDKFEAQLMYEGSGLPSEIRL